VCNAGSSDDDLLIAVLGRFDPLNGQGNSDGQLSGLLKSTDRQAPGVLRKMLPSIREARRYNRRLGITPKPGQLHQETGVMNMPNELIAAVSTLAAKLTKGMFYNVAKAIFPSDGTLVMHWFTNEELIKTGSYPIFEMMQGLTGHAPLLRRSGKSLDDQFECKFTIDEKGELLALQSRFRSSFGFVVFGSTLKGQLEGILESIRTEIGGDPGFTIL
jgi:hypothetical protein